MKKTEGNRPTGTGWRWTAAWLGFAAISAVTLAYFVAVYMPHERAGAIDVWRGRLSAMADDRKAAITTWVDERHADAEVLSEYPAVALLIDAGHGAPVPLPAEEAPRLHLQVLLDSARAVYGYDGVYVFDASGQAAATSTGSPPLGADCLRDSELVLRSGVAQVDFHAREDGSPMLAIVTPVRASGRAIGTVVLVMDPGRWLYPLLRSEPTHTSTAEALLARQAGDQIEFLSPLRHSSAPPLTFRLPLETHRLAAASAVRGEEVFTQYMDYRGVPALGVTRRIPNTAWGLVVKVDEDEALAGFRRSVRQSAFAIAGLLLAVAGFSFGAQRAMAGRHRRELGESEARFALLRDHANDAILFAGRDGVILDVNRRAEQLYVRRREDLLGLPFDELRAPEERAALRDQLDALARDEQLVFEAVHRRPDGTRFPVEVSIRVMQLGEQEVFLSIVRDITERKRTEERIATLNRLLRTISEVNELIVREHGRDRLLAEACRIVVEHGGFRMAWVGFADAATGTVVPATWAGFDDGYLGGIGVRFDDTPLGRGPTGTTIREGRAVVVDDWETDERVVPWREAARARGYRSSASFPIPAGGKVTGALSVYAAEAHAFEAEVTDLLGELAGDIAFALEAMDAAARREVAERSLAGSEERFRIAAETSNDVVYEWDLKQSVQWFGNVDEILGYGPGEFPRTLDGWAACVHPDDVERAMAAIRAHLEKRVPYAIEYRVRRQDGTYRWWTARGAAARTPDGKPVRWVGTITDITERKQGEEILRASEARYRTLVENIPQKIFMKDRSFRFVSINENFAHDLGIRPAEAVGKADADFFPLELAAKYHEDDVRILETGKTEVLEERYLQEGRESWVSTIKTPVRDADGEIVGVLGVFWDITERRRAEADRARLAAIVEGSDDAIFVKSLDGRILTWNLGAQRLYGYSAAEAIGQPVTILAPPENADEVGRLTRVIQQGDHVDHYEITRVRKDGTRLDVALSISPIRDVAGTVVGAATIARDVSARHRAEEALRKSEARLRAVLDATPFPIALVDVEDDKIEFWSHSALTLFGHTAPTAGEWFQMAYPNPDYRREVTDRWKPRLEEAKLSPQSVNTGEYRVTCRDGSVRICELHAAFLPDKLIVTFNDITERKRAEEEIQRLNAELEERVRQRTAQLEAANKELEAFSYSVSHDLRAPLRAIDGFSRIVQEEYAAGLDDEGKRQLGVIRANAQKMGRLIDDLLTFSRAGRTELHRARVAMGPLVLAVFSEVVPGTEERERIDLSVGDLPDAWADPALIRQVWVNLLSNAVKFSRPRPRAEIKVSASRHDNRIVYRVEDNGVGFDMQFADKLFGVFQRLHSTREFEGTGVGLALVQRIVRRHDGEVWGEGTVDGGATFSFALPEEGIHEQR